MLCNWCAACRHDEAVNSFRLSFGPRHAGQPTGTLCTRHRHHHPVPHPLSTLRPSTYGQSRGNAGHSASGYGMNTHVSSSAAVGGCRALRRRAGSTDPANLVGRAARPGRRSGWFAASTPCTCKSGPDLTSWRRHPFREKRRLSQASQGQVLRGYQEVEQHDHSLGH